MSISSKEKLLEELRKINVYKPGKYEGSSGRILDGYLGLDKIIAYPEICKDFAYLLGDLIFKHSPEVTCIAAPELGDALLAKDVSTAWLLPLTVVRKKEKEHGNKELRIGHITTKKDKAAICTDVTSTGRSLNYTASIIIPTEAQIVGYFTCVLREDVKLEYDFEVKYLFTLADLI